MGNNPSLITSFTIDHDILEPGIYVSRIDGDITTYDLRTRKPNMGDYMSDLTMHSVEHMVATYIRSSAIKDDVIYFGPMGCQTGFYLLVRNADNQQVLTILKQALNDILVYEGPVFGAEAKQCGNYRNLDLNAAKVECQRYLNVLESNPSIDFKYKEAAE